MNKSTVTSKGQTTIPRAVPEPRPASCIRRECHHFPTVGQKSLTNREARELFIVSVRHQAWIGRHRGKWAGGNCIIMYFQLCFYA